MYPDIVIFLPKKTIIFQGLLNQNGIRILDESIKLKAGETGLLRLQIQFSQYLPASTVSKEGTIQIQIYPSAFQIPDPSAIGNGDCTAYFNSTSEASFCSFNNLDPPRT